MEREPRRELLEFLKRDGPTSVLALQEVLGLSASTVRHHLHILREEGLIERVTSPNNGVAGRPSRHYVLSAHAEGVFPKRYEELLDEVLRAVTELGLLEPVLSQVATQLAARLGQELPSETEAALATILQRLDFGDMLGVLRAQPAGWEVTAYNCLYHETGLKFVGVCDLIPRAVTQATGLTTERLGCQRDGRAACQFFIARP